MLSKLKLVRLQKGLKTKEVAEKLHVSVSYVSKLENGSAVVTMQILQRLADVYGIPANTMI